MARFSSCRWTIACASAPANAAARRLDRNEELQIANFRFVFFNLKSSI
jgi:hypothetical protein